ncbi:MAG: acetylornithine deacetylase [Chloroflexota bacterium]|nr:MAG: acetylornithine deacetylase [Chloroflexota bacterium]
MKNLTELTTLLADLVRIDSINPDLIAGAKGEADVAAFIAEWATRTGLEVIVQEAAPGRPNVMVIARGSGGGKNLMLNGHTDTVGLTGMDEPFNARIEGNRMYGRGTYDMKSGLAASLMAAKRAKSLHLSGDVIVTCVADEEVASLGSQAICRELPRWRPDAVIVTEPTEMEIAVAHKGFGWFDIETFGVAAHGSRPHLGVDAIAKMGRVLVELEQYDLQLRTNPTHPYLGSGSLHASIIQGGQEMSSYPAYCKLQIERRTLPGELPAEVQAQLQVILDRCASSDSTFNAKLTPGLARSAFEINEDTPLVQLCCQQLAQVTGTPAKLSGVSYWADSGLFAAADVPTLLLGPRGFGAHGPVEWIDLDTVQQCADVYTAVAQVFCR